jgi:acyl carrier protein
MGSTEVRGIASAIIDQTYSFPSEGAPVGYPRPGSQIFILDEKGREVTDGQIGEIAIKSQYIAVEHHAESQFALSAATADDSGVYLTGDLGKLSPDGFLIHMGRKDLTVKVRGYRIAIEEVEQALRDHPAVAEAAVTAWDHGGVEDKSLEAHVAFRQDRVASVGELSTFLRRRLPGYMIPSAFKILPNLPLTNGKVDRRVLARIERIRPRLENPYVASRSDNETQLVQIWEEVLDLRPVGIHDNFFELGGHSLAAMRVVTHIIKQFQLDLPLRSLFGSPTVAEMARVIAEHRGKRASEDKLITLLAELESLSNKEAERQLGEEKTRGDRETNDE